MGCRTFVAAIGAMLGACAPADFTFAEGDGGGPDAVGSDASVDSSLTDAAIDAAVDGGSDSGASDGSSGAVTYSQTFAGNVPTAAQCTAWQNFRLALSGTYTKLTFSGSNDPTGITCTGIAASQLCTDLHNGTTTTSAISCGGTAFSIGSCGSDVAIGNVGQVCMCFTAYNYQLTPCAGFGGAIDASSCGSETQTLTLTCSP